MPYRQVASVWANHHDDMSSWTIEVRCDDGSKWYFPCFGTRSAVQHLLLRVHARKSIDTDRWVAFIPARDAEPRTELDILMHGGDA